MVISSMVLEKNEFENCDLKYSVSTLTCILCVLCTMPVWTAHRFGMMTSSRSDTGGRGFLVPRKSPFYNRTIVQIQEKS